tara:strand:+ start:203 stop:766 length:564 start_codon:yes stop_codon:yes gene_type:complete
MKTIKILSLMILVSGIYSCSSVYSSYGEKRTEIEGGCDDCFSNSKFYRGLGEMEVDPEQPGARIDALSEAKLIARNAIIKEIEAQGQVTEKRFSHRVGKKIENTYAESVHSQAFNQLQDTELKCRKTVIVDKGRKEKKTLVASVCIEMSKKDFDDSVYKENYEMFSKSGIDKATYDIWMTSRVVKKN